MRIKLKEIFITLITRRNGTFIDSDEETRYRSYAAFCLTGLPIMLAFGVYHLAIANYTLACIIFSSYAALVSGLYLLYNGIATRAVYRLNTFIFFLLLLYMMAVGGNDYSKALWCYTFPMIGYFLLGNREGTLWNVLLLGVCQYLFLNPHQLSWLHAYPASFSFRFTLSYTAVTIVTFFYERFRYTYRQRIEEQNRQLSNEVSERGKMETALRISEEKYKAIYLQATEGILVINPLGNILECNPQMSRMLGTTPDDLIGVNVHTIIHPDDLTKTPSQVSRILNGETIRLERQLRTANSGYRLFEQSGRLIDNNRIMLLYRDITDRKAAEMALEQANRELEKIANLDGLTQIANRRKFETKLQEEWKRLGREYQPLSIIIGDIDYFKQYNDLYGHQEGDSCLITIAHTIAHTLQRPADLVARFGGEEFIALLPNTHLDGSMQMAEVIRSRIAQLRIPHKGSACCPYVTMSFGVSSTIPDRDTIAEDLIAYADKALYQAKQNGRNRIEAAEPLFPAETLAKEL